MTIERGKIVWLKTGGPSMTVKTQMAGMWYCTWFDKNGEVREHGFTESQLTETDPNKKDKAKDF